MTPPEPAPTVRPELDSVKSLLLDMAQERSVRALLETIVARLARRPHVALVRIWLVQPPSDCSKCPPRDDCRDKSLCLHLVASEGRSIRDHDERWNSTDVPSRRLPLSPADAIGRVAAEGVGLSLPDAAERPEVAVRPEWLQEEEIQGFGAQPLSFKGDVLGVIAAWLRVPNDPEGASWLRLIADHAAAAIANAHAFAQIEGLRRQLERENEYLREEVMEAQAFGDIVGNSPPLRAALRQIELVAPTEASVLVLGESGTGKELIAREIHRRSARANRPLVKVNCASVPRELYESEFFGHALGAFTGAVRARAGRFELADGGTLFLDEVGEIPPELQSKLLRVLQEGTFERLGEEETRTADVRVIAATNRDLRAEVEAGRFRQDLYYRINVFPIELAPLRNRREDIPALAKHFLAAGARRLGVKMPRLTPADLIALQGHAWPGNVRELQNVIERALITSRDGRFELGALAPAARRDLALEESAADILTEADLRERERENMRRALEACEWRVYGERGAAGLLGLKPTTLASRMRKLGLERQR